MFTILDLCAGTGGMSLAFKNVIKLTELTELTEAVDNAKESEVIFNSNNKIRLTLKDINDYTPTKPFDILLAGFPCQPFSYAGKQLGFEDKRSNVFFSIIDIMKTKKPKFVLLENVIGLKKELEFVLQSIRDIDYYVNYYTLDSAEYTGIPQHRERIYFCCTLKPQTVITFTKVPLKPLKDFLEENYDSKVIYTPKLKVYDLIKKEVVKDNVVYQYRRTHVRENKSGVCPTLTANMGTGGHNVPIIKDKDIIRKLTPRECFNLQGFPQSYILPSTLSNSMLYKLAGNAVNVKMIEIIINEFLKLNII